MFMRSLRPQAFAAASRAMSSGAGGKAKKSFLSSWTFRLGATAAGSVLAYGWIDRTYFHQRIESEVLDDLMLQKGGLRKERVVVLGTGWGSVGFLARIDPTRYEVVCISPRNYFLMTPLLPSVTVGTVEPRTVVESVRTLFPWVKFVEAECTGLDPKTKLLKLSNSSQTSSSRVVMDSAKSRPTFALAYDKLVVAVGAENNTFGTPGVEKHAHFLKEISDARRIRSAVTDAFESAANPGQTDEERRRLLNFVVVGGGPTGVEFAAELADLVHEDLKYSFPQLKGMVTIRLVEAMETVLSMFDAKISEYTMEHFKTERIEVLNHTFVKEVKANEVMINKKGTKEIFGIPASVVVWATGIKCRPIINSMKEAIGPLQNNFRGLLTDGYLKVLGAEGIYSLGDCATIENKQLSGQIDELYKGALALSGEKARGVTPEAFKQFVEKNVDSYPQLSFIAGTDAADEEFKKADKNRDGLLIADEFKAALASVDRRIKILPATAQVAAQEGKYLAKQFNQHPVPQGLQDGGSMTAWLRKQYNSIQYPQGMKPFHYNHMGSLAYIGGDQAAADMRGSWTTSILDQLGLSVASGKGVYLLWRSFYLSESFTARTKILLFMDWVRCKTFGRDISRY